jgi:hypothetical protein
MRLISLSGILLLPPIVLTTLIPTMNSLSGNAQQLLSFLKRVQPLHQQKISLKSIYFGTVNSGVKRRGLKDFIQKPTNFTAKDSKDYVHVFEDLNLNRNNMFFSLEGRNRRRSKSD